MARLYVFAAYVKINRTEAYSLFDSGSTTDAVTPDFTRVAALEAKETGETSNFTARLLRQSIEN